jgi:hypothetical protein
MITLVLFMGTVLTLPLTSATGAGLVSLASVHITATHNSADVPAAHGWRSLAPLFRPWRLYTLGKPRVITFEPRQSV